MDDDIAQLALPWAQAERRPEDFNVRAALFLVGAPVPPVTPGLIRSLPGLLPRPSRTMYRRRLLGR